MKINPCPLHLVSPLSGLTTTLTLDWHEAQLWLVSRQDDDEEEWPILEGLKLLAEEEIRLCLLWTASGWTIDILSPMRTGHVQMGAEIPREPVAR